MGAITQPFQFCRKTIFSIMCHEKELIFYATEGGRLCPPNNTGTRKFSDLPTALCNSNQVKVVTAYFQHIHFFAPSHLKICKAKVGTQYLAL